MFCANLKFLHGRTVSKVFPISQYHLIDNWISGKLSIDDSAEKFTAETVPLILLQANGRWEISIPQRENFNLCKNWLHVFFLEFFSKVINSGVYWENFTNCHFMNKFRFCK